MFRMQNMATQCVGTLYSCVF